MGIKNYECVRACRTSDREIQLNANFTSRKWNDGRKPRMTCKIYFIAIFHRLSCFSKNFTSATKCQLILVQFSRVHLAANCYGSNLATGYDKAQQLD